VFSGKQHSEYFDENEFFLLWRKKILLLVLFFILLLCKKFQTVSSSLYRFTAF